MASSNNDHDQVNAAAGPLKRLWGKIIKFGLKLKKLEQDDPRRIVHSLKVALALILVSLLFYFQPLYEGFGLEAMWAILTVTVVFDFSVGATIGRGLNRLMATLVAAALGIGAHRLATLAGNQGEPILIALFVDLHTSCNSDIPEIHSPNDKCAFKIEALNNYITSNFQTPQEVKSIIQGPSTIISSECGKVLKELATAMRKLTKSSSTENKPRIGCGIRLSSLVQQLQ
ncbi:hypothetical protein M0R45_034305 [Rubus argutus]|uniref:Uncharacterized protein n=1 Tax=Rubus argutus TaxID=59490 RepID=A0AAW1VU33_RUBAR